MRDEGEGWSGVEASRRRRRRPPVPPPSLRPLSRYGLIGPNGCGKSTLLKCLGNREVPIPEHIGGWERREVWARGAATAGPSPRHSHPAPLPPPDIYYLDREIEASDMTALDAVKSVDEMRERLEKEAEALADAEDAESQALLADIYERLDKLEADNTEARAGQILHGLGFTKAMQAKKTKDFSGGWRMRIALARALFVDPAMLILDEPTNHLDLEACVWLEDTLAKFERILLLVSHSQDFMNGVCTNILHMHQKGGARGGAARSCAGGVLGARAACARSHDPPPPPRPPCRHQVVRRRLRHVRAHAGRAGGRPNEEVPVRRDGREGRGAHARTRHPPPTIPNRAPTAGSRSRSPT